MRCPIRTACLSLILSIGAVPGRAHVPAGRARLFPATTLSWAQIIHHALNSPLGVRRFNREADSPSPLAYQRWVRNANGDLSWEQQLRVGMFRGLDPVVNYMRRYQPIARLASRAETIDALEDEGARQRELGALLSFLSEEDLERLTEALKVWERAAPALILERAQALRAQAAENPVMAEALKEALALEDQLGELASIWGNQALHQELRAVSELRALKERGFLEQAAERVRSLGSNLENNGVLVREVTAQESSIARNRELNDHFTANEQRLSWPQVRELLLLLVESEQRSSRLALDYLYKKDMVEARIIDRHLALKGRELAPSTVLEIAATRRHLFETNRIIEEHILVHEDRLSSDAIRELLAGLREPPREWELYLRPDSIGFRYSPAEVRRRVYAALASRYAI